MSTHQRKQERDYTPETDTLLSSLATLPIDAALDRLAALEKLTRNAADLKSTTRILEAVVDQCASHRAYDALSAQITLLAKKNGQLKAAVQAMVDKAFALLPALDAPAKLALIDTLRTVTEGKIYLEVARARVTRLLASIREDAADLAAASALLQEVQVETFTSMDKREKLDFILEQMRLLKLTHNWDMLHIVSHKVNLKWLAEDANTDLKIRFYNLMILYALRTHKFIDVSRYYYQLYTTDTVDKPSALRNMVFFTILAPYTNDQSDALHRLKKDDKLQDIPECFNLVKCFTTPEIMRWPGIEQVYGPALRATRVFGQKGTTGVDGDILQDIDADQGDKRWAELKSRVVEHNLRVIEKYYDRVTLKRLSELLDLNREDTEQLLNRLVVEKMVYARIDRPNGTVDFRKKKSVEEALDEWSYDVHKLMNLIEGTCHLIAKEQAVHAAKLQKKAAIASSA